MRKAIVLIVLLMAVRVMAQEKSTILVKSHELNSGVYVISAQMAEPAGSNALTPGKTRFELHCNKGMPDCTAPQPGTYTMVRLPKNWGMYECANVDLYSISEEGQSAQKVGEYCFIEKKD